MKREKNMGILVSQALAVLPEGMSHRVGRHDLYVEGTDIVGIDEAPEGFVASEVIDGSRRLAIPGLINAHTHTYMSMMRNIADDLSFSDWLFGAIVPIEDRLVPEDAYWGSLLAQVEMIRSGTTCFNDMPMFVDQIARATRESGMRAVLARGLQGDDYDRDDFRLAQTMAARRDNADCGRLTFALGPHAPYTCGPDYLRMVADVAREEGMLVHIHIAEAQSETDGIAERYGCTPVEYVAQSGLFDSPTIAAHCVRVSESDRAILAGHGVSVVTNPASNMKLGNGFAPVPEMIGAGINVCLGTDGAASNNAQNMFRELGLLALIHKGTHDTPQCISANEAFRMATRNAAAALGLPTGSIEVGKRADLVLLDLDAPSLTPLNNAVAALAYSANGSEVTDVIVDGKPVMRNRELLTIDEERVRFEIGRVCTRLVLA